jgi:hypothetical protein
MIWSADWLLSTSHFAYSSYLEGFLLAGIKADNAVTIGLEIKKMLMFWITQNDIHPNF